MRWVGAVCVLVFCAIAWGLYWKDDPYRDGAEAFVRGDPGTAQTVGDIRRVNLKRVSQGSCSPACPTYDFSVVGTRAIVRVSVLVTTGAAGTLQFRIAPTDQR